MTSFAKHLACSLLVFTALLFQAAAQDADASSAFVPGVPTPAHVVIVVEENHGYSQIIGSAQAPYINSLASQGALFTNSYAVAHPSQPNYLALFSGSTQGMTDDSCPHTFSTGSLESELIGIGKKFIGFSEGLPSVGSTTCATGLYVRKHAPWTDFSQDNSAYNQPLTWMPTNYADLTKVS